MTRFVPTHISVTAVVDALHPPEVGDSYRRLTDLPGQSCVRVNSVKPGRTSAVLGDPPKYEWYTVNLGVETYVRIEDLGTLVPTRQRRKTDLYEGKLEVRTDGRVQGFGSTSIEGTKLSWVLREYRPIEAFRFDLVESQGQEQRIFRMEIGPHVPAENDFYETLYEAKLYEYPWEVRTSHGYS